MWPENLRPEARDLRNARIDATVPVMDWEELNRVIDADLQAAHYASLQRMADQIPAGTMITMPASYTTRPLIGDHITYGLRLQSWPGFHDEWITSDARAIAAGIVESGDWSRLAILADAVQDAGCEDAALLGLMRLAGSLGLDMGGWWLMERMTSQQNT